MVNRELAVSLDEVREKNLEQLKLINSVVFPIKFPVGVPMQLSMQHTMMS